MSDKRYEYWGMMAKLWDFFRGDTSTWADRAFYLQAIEKYGQPVLDVGCGTGRLLVDFAAQGIDIDGVDNSPEMLLLCVEKAAEAGVSVNLEEQLMQELSMARKYQVILVPSSSFMLLTNQGDARKALRRFYDHLLPGGRLIMPFMEFWREGDPLDTGWQLNAERVRDEDGALLKRWQRSVHHPETQLEDTEDRYEVWMNDELVDSETHVWSPATRWYTQSEPRALYAEAGFTNIEEYSGFTWEPVKPEDTLFTVIGQRPS